jgi:DNA gyrase/topoisomerase IV subunit B
MAGTYSAADIEVLEGLEPVRKRPGMYIGGTEGPQGLHHLVREIVDNSVDEAMNGHADSIVVTLHKDCESVTVEDNGRGIPVDIHPKFKKPALELLLTTLHSGGKFSDRNYRSAGGLHGVGASVVNALSSDLKATVWRDGFEWTQNFERGKVTSKIEKGPKTKQHGTKIFFRPDDTIFRAIKLSRERIEAILEEKAFLNKGLRLKFIDEGKNESKEFLYPDGVLSYLNSMLARQEQQPVGGEVFTLDREDGIKIEVAFCWTESTSGKILSYVNGIATGQGGSHEDGFRSGIGKAIRNYMGVHNLLPKGVKVGGEDFREGLFAVLSVNVPGSVSQLQFQGQTKDKLNNPEIEEPVDTLVRSFENTLNSKPKVSALIIERILLAAKARAAARSAADSVSRKVGISQRLNLPGKLADCSSNKADLCELLIVEGESAGGTAKQGRDRNIQAVLPLKGKVLNSFNVASDKIGENKELIDLVSALGCGIGESIRLEKLRYGKVIILTDADADGMHIASLLMAFFYRFMRPLVDAGHLYLGVCPLFRIRIGGGAKAVDHWANSDEERDRILKEKVGRSQVHVTRFKGLGEMNAKTLWETTLNPRGRNLLKIQVDDASAADRTFENLLGKDASARYRLIQENAHRLELDL